MYSVYCDNEVLFDPNVDELKIFNPKITLEVNKTGGFDFTVYPTHPLYGAIRKFKSAIEVYDDDFLLFRGRVLDYEEYFDKARAFVCEGDLAFLLDSKVRPYEFSGGVREYLELLINSHNGQVETEKQFIVRNVTVTDPNDYITRADSTYPDTWSVIEDKLIESLGGYLVLERVDGVNYLDYLVDSEYKSLQVIELGQNLLDIKQTNKGADIATAVIPIGAKLENEDGSEERLTITSINDGVDYVFNQEAVDRYGWIYKVVTFDDVTIQSNLLRKGEEELVRAIQSNVTIELTALDLSLIDLSIDKFRFFEYVEARSEAHDIDGLFLISKMTIDIINPENNKMTVGVEYSTFTEQQHSTDKAIKKMNADYVSSGRVTTIQNKTSEIEKRTITIDGNVEALQTDLSFIQADITTLNDNDLILSDAISDLEVSKDKFEDLNQYVKYENGVIAIESDVSVLGSINNEASIEPEILNGWLGNAYYWKDKNGIVHIGGVVDSGVIDVDTTIFNLPTNYRPLNDEFFINATDNGAIKIDVTNVGDVKIGSTTTASWIALSGMSFRAVN